MLNGILMVMMNIIDNFKALRAVLIILYVLINISVVIIDYKYGINDGGALITVGVCIIDYKFDTNVNEVPISLGACIIDDKYGIIIDGAPVTV